MAYSSWCTSSERGSGRVCILLVDTCGTATGIAGAAETRSIHDLAGLADVAEKHGIHFHVDAAWSGPSLFSKDLRKKIAGIEKSRRRDFCAKRVGRLRTRGSGAVPFRGQDSKLHHPQRIHGSWAFHARGVQLITLIVRIGGATHVSFTMPACPCACCAWRPGRPHPRMRSASQAGPS